MKSDPITRQPHPVATSAACHDCNASWSGPDAMRSAEDHLIAHGHTVSTSRLQTVLLRPAPPREARPKPRRLTAVNGKP